MTSKVNENLKSVAEFYSIPTMPDGLSSDENFENGHIDVLFAAGYPLSSHERSIAFLNSNASVILFPLDNIVTIAAKITYDNAQEAYKKLNLASPLLDRNEYEKAEVIYWESLKIFPTPEGYFKLSSLYLSYKNYDDVESICKRGLKTTRVIISSNEAYLNEFDVFAFIYLNLGIALQAQNKNREAKAAFLKSAAIDPRLVQEHTNHSNTTNQSHLQKTGRTTDRKKKIFGMKLWQVIVLGVMILILISSLLFLMSILF